MCQYNDRCKVGTHKPGTKCPYTRQRRTRCLAQRDPLRSKKELQAFRRSAHRSAPTKRATCPARTQDATEVLEPRHKNRDKFTGKTTGKN